MRKQIPVVVTAVTAALLFVPATYAMLRAYDVLFKDEPNPANVAWSAHIAMFWRLAISGYLAGMVVPLAFMAARRDLHRTLRTLYILVFVVAGMIVVQGLLLP